MTSTVSPAFKCSLEITSRSDTVVLEHGGYDISIEKKKKANSMPVPVLHERHHPLLTSVLEFNWSLKSQ